MNARIAPETEPPAYRPSRRQNLILMGLGAGLWYMASLIIRFGAPYGLFELKWAPALYLITVPVLWTNVALGQRVAGLTSPQTIPGVTLMAMTALLLDGAGLVWARGLYGTDTASVLGGAAWLLWAVGVAFAIAFLGLGMPVSARVAGDRTHRA